MNGKILSIITTLVLLPFLAGFTFISPEAGAGRYVLVADNSLAENVGLLDSDRDEGILNDEDEGLLEDEDEGFFDGEDSDLEMPDADEGLFDGEDEEFLDDEDN